MTTDNKNYCPKCGTTPCYISFLGFTVECSNVMCSYYSEDLYPVISCSTGTDNENEKSSNEVKSFITQNNQLIDLTEEEMEEAVRQAQAIIDSYYDSPDITQYIPYGPYGPNVNYNGGNPFGSSNNGNNSGGSEIDP